MDRYKEAAFGWVDRRMGDLSDWNQIIWHYGETALREYKSAAWYVARLKQEGFEVEAGTGGMPTAFRATWSNGAGPRIAAYAEYDAVPGNCQAAATRKMPRAGLSPHAGGHTDPHSALGISALGGALAAKAAMTELGLKGTIVLLRRAGGEAAPVEAGPCGQGLLRQARRRDQLPPDLHAAAGQHRALGHPLRRRLCLHLHLRMRTSRKAG